MSKSQRDPARRARAGSQSNPNKTAAHPSPARFRRRHPVITALVPVGLVIAAIATLVAVKATEGPAVASGAASKLAAGGENASADTGITSLPAQVLSNVTAISPSVFDAVGSPQSVNAPVSITGAPALSRGADGKPQITYIGAEYCPFCAAERWALVAALSRFGTFSGLAATHSSSTDVYPDTQTLSFYGSTYVSPYVDFTPVEEQSNQRAGNSYATLQTPTKSEVAMMSTYDSAPYTDYPGSIPFLDIGNRSVIIGASYSPEVLQGLSLQEIGRDLQDPSSPVAQAIDGTANQITASICEITGDQPSSVCDSPAIAAILKERGH